MYEDCKCIHVISSLLECYEWIRYSEAQELKLGLCIGRPMVPPTLQVPTPMSDTGPVRVTVCHKARFIAPVGLLILAPFLPVV